MTDTLPIAGSLLIAIQHGPLVTVRIDGCEGEIVMGVDKWLALRATADVLGAADKRHKEDVGEISVLREQIEYERKLHASLSAEYHNTARRTCESLAAQVDALKQECERMRAVYEAAVKWRSGWPPNARVGGMTKDVADLFNAIDTALSQDKERP